MFTEPCCERCLDERFDRKQSQSAVIRASVEERCVFCGKRTTDGIYVQIGVEGREKVRAE